MATGSSDPQTDGRRKQAGAVLALFGMVAIVAGVAIAIAAAVRTPTWEGVLGGIVGAVFVALLLAVSGAWLAMRIVSPREKPVIDPTAGADIEASLRDVLAELEQARLDTVAQVNARAMWRVPLCAGLGLLLWTYGQFSDEPGDLMDLGSLIVVPAMMGYLWSSLELSNKYAKLYKTKVLPRLAASFGDITYRLAVAPDMSRLKDECVFRRFDEVIADDEFHGAHRGLPMNIVELKLDHGSGKSRKTVFDGLLVTLDLPRDTNAITAVVSDAGALGNFADRMKAQHRERVRLEDPVFEKIYEVYGTDQVAARALLTPAFMEKFRALGQRPDFEAPLLLCSGRILQIAMPKRSGRNLFEPPSFQKPAASRETLIQLRDDIAAVMAAADAVIDLDHRFAVMARK